MYKNEEDMPKEPKSGGKVENLYSMRDFKSQAMDTAYGQGGEKGCKSDEAKIRAQHFTGAFSSDE